MFHLLLDSYRAWHLLPFMKPNTDFDMNRFEIKSLFHISVPPKFVQQPQNRIAHVNSDNHFQCDIVGSPRPEIIWMKDGMVIKPSDYFKIIDKKHLSILGLLSSDAGMYQCFGNNSIGNVQASVQLMVVEQSELSPLRCNDFFFF